MIEFDEKFFQDEIRDGFYVDGIMKRQWAAGLETLVEIDRICKKYGITYFAYAGTLIGAVRHNGFIPWDDDLDIIMFRKDFMRFLSAAEKELPSPFICYDIYHDETWIRTFARVNNSCNAVNLAPEFLERFHGCPYWTGVDIFVFDEQPESKEEFHMIVKLTQGLLEIIDILDKNETADEKERQEKSREVEEMLLTMEELCGMSIDRRKNLRHQLFRLIDGLWASHNDGICERVATNYFVQWRDYYYSGCKKEWYRESIELPFEGIMIPVPIDFHEVLKQLYGNDYLSPIRYSHYANRDLHRVYRNVENYIRTGKEKLDRWQDL